LDVLEKLFDSGTEINNKILSQAGVIDDPKTPFKVLGTGKLSKPFTIVPTRYSKKAEQLIKKAGGSISALE